MAPDDTLHVIETYEYDYLGNRTAKTSSGVTTEYTTDLSSGYSQVLKATIGSDSVYYTRGFELISRQEGSDVSYYIYDGGLSVRVLTDASGSVTDTLVFDAFGNNAEKTGTTDNSYGFQGEEQDSTGLYYLRARYMDPSTGTFTSMDTYGGSLSDPMSLHKYMFANANPVKYCDPSGHASKEELMAVIDINAMLEGALYNSFFYLCDFMASGKELEVDNCKSWASFISGLIWAFTKGAAFGQLGSSISKVLGITDAAKISFRGPKQAKIATVLLVFSFMYVLPLAGAIKFIANDLRTDYDNYNDFLADILDELSDSMMQILFATTDKIFGLPVGTIGNAESITGKAIELFGD
ncbi:MAG: RHS repeat-associated core domain-containing protein [Saccharofermentans sp.]|nr:RHS repeat-associated core domain-containing protein [Saccharofermentans sp.]